MSPFDNAQSNPNRSFPFQATLGLPDTLHIQTIVVDMDGTMMGSYKAIEAAHALVHNQETANWLRINEDESDKEIVTALVEAISNAAKEKGGMENLLHQPKETLRTIVRRFAASRNAGFPPEDIFNAVDALADQSFHFFAGVTDFMHMAHTARVPFIIYTNTSPEHSVLRLSRAGANPDHVAAIYARPRGDFAAIPFINQYTSEIERGLAACVIPYRVPKPNPEPLREIMKFTGALPENTLFIGEGASDVGSAFPDGEGQVCHFAYQLCGAQEITPEQVSFNARLRDGHPLGHEHVEQNFGVTCCKDILCLRGGFESLVRRVKDGRLILVAPPQLWPLPPQQRPQAPRHG